jgi:hypothetical protein
VQLSAVQGKAQPRKHTMPFNVLCAAASDTAIMAVESTCSLLCELCTVPSTS